MRTGQSRTHGSVKNVGTIVGVSGGKCHRCEAPVHMALLGRLITTDTVKPIILARDCVHHDDAPYRILTMPLDAQL